MERSEIVKYPKSVFFIISNEFCERFSYYGIWGILTIYLRNILGYSDDEATVIFHIFSMLSYFSAVFGGVIADNWLGKFRTIFYFSIVHAAGNILVSVASAAKTIKIPAREVTILGLILTAVGTGGITPCMSALGGDQFLLPQQKHQLDMFFSLFYVTDNMGAFLSILITPILRQDVKCLGQDSCYPLALGLPACLMIISLLIFVFGKRWYAIKNPQENALQEIFKCMAHAVSRKRQSKEVKRDHWLDHADDKYSRDQIEGIQATLRVLLLFVPLPVFWALFDQMGSRWAFQASRMNGSVGFWTIKPDQMIIVNTILVITLVPLFQVLVYPLLAKCNLLKKPLQRMCIGGYLVASAFIISAAVDFQLEPTYAQLPGGGEGQLRIFNGLDCPVNLNTNFSSEIKTKTLGPLEMWDGLTLDVFGSKMYSVDVSGCDHIDDLPFLVNITESQAKSYFLAFNFMNETMLFDATSPNTDYDILEKSYDGYPTIKVLYNFLKSSHYNEIKFINRGGGRNLTLDLPSNKPTTRYEILETNSVATWLTHVFDVLVCDPCAVARCATFPESSDGRTITLGEILFSVTGLQFAFTQAPLNMKSVLTSAWLLTTAFGDLIVVIVAEVKVFNRQAYEFLLFAGLMIVDTIIFSLMAMRYIYVEYTGEGNGSHREH